MGSKRVKEDANELYEQMILKKKKHR